jgi:hypothetical protein
MLVRARRDGSAQPLEPQVLTCDYLWLHERCHKNVIIRPGSFGSKGGTFLHCVSVSSGPVRAIDPPFALLILLIRYFRKHNDHLFKDLYSVMQQVLVFHRRRTFEEEVRIGAMLLTHCHAIRLQLRSIPFLPRIQRRLELRDELIA